MVITIFGVLFWPWEGGSSVANVLVLGYCGSLLYIQLWHNRSPSNNEITNWFNTDIRDAARYRYIRNNQTWIRNEDTREYDGIKVDDSYALVGTKFPYEFDFQARPMLDHHIDTMMEREKNE